MLEAIPDILTTPIIPASTNAFWDEYPGPVSPRPLLILSDVLAANTEDIQLTKMLQACKLMPENYNIVTLVKTQKAAWHKLKKTFEPKAVLLLGIMPESIAISAMFRLNEPNHFGNCTFIPTLSIAVLEQQPEMKRQLWITGLKPVFVDNLYGYL
jgi:hypothetical protein